MTAKPGWNQGKQVSGLSHLRSKQHRHSAVTYVTRYVTFRRMDAPRTATVHTRSGFAQDARACSGARHRPSLAHVSLRVGAALLAIILTVFAVGVTPLASADEDQYTAFYTPPDPLPDGKPGDLIRTEPSRIVLEPSGQLGAFMATGTRIMYLSKGAQGESIAVTGTYFEPTDPWTGRGPRPLISFATGTYGMGDQCAPSRLFNQGIHWSSGADLTVNYEETFIATMVARGFAIVVTDYEGLGTPGVPTFLNRLAEGQVVLDAARAAMKLPETSLDPHGPVAFWGWSEGGAASASAAELAPSYAPELHLVGAFAAAPVADPSLVMPFADGNMLVGIIGYFLNGLIASYPVLEDSVMDALTPRGRDLVIRTQTQCLLETVMKHGFRQVDPYFATDPATLISAEPLKTIMASQRIGSLKPAVPVFLQSNRYDPFIPWEGVHQLAADWCAKVADVQLWTNEEPPFLNKTSMNHLLPYFVDGERGMQWIADRFNHLPTTPNCDQV
jgi:hypothetical protein